MHQERLNEMMIVTILEGIFTSNIGINIQ